MSTNYNWLGLPFHRQDKGVNKERGKTHRGKMLQLWYSGPPCQGLPEQCRSRKNANSFNVDNEAEQLKADVEGMLLEEGMDFFSVIKQVGFLGIRHAEA